MRLRRLSLTRYGKFTDRAIEFGPRMDGAPDLHIVFGPNEAGKSTAFNAYLDLLYGIEVQSRYGFLHPYDRMRIGACLELSVGPRELVRVKRRTPSLLDAADEVVPEAVIAGDLGGLDRNGYRAMFSLDDDTLERGGDSILASNGELGQLLFSASAGLAELGRTLEGLRAEAREFAAKGAHKTELNTLKAALEATRRERDAADVFAPEFARLDVAQRQTRERYEAGKAELATLRERADRLQRTRTALPRLTALRRVRARLAELGPVPDVPDGWLAEIPGLLSTESKLREETVRLEAEIARLSASLEGLVVDERSLALAGGLGLLDGLSVRERAAAMDLPQRRTELSALDGRIAGLLRRLDRSGEADPARLVPSAAQEAVFGALAARRSGVAAQVSAAQKERDEAAAALGEAQQAVGAHPGAAPDGLSGLAHALASLHRSDATRRLRDATEREGRQVAVLATRLAALAPWSGDGAALARVTALLPDADTAAMWRQQAEGHVAAVARCELKRDRLAEDLAARTAEAAALGMASGVMADGDAAEVRTRREAAWADHRRALDPATAAVFEAALRRDDLVTAARLGNERMLGQLQDAEAARLMARDGLGRAQAALDAALLARTAHATTVAHRLAAVDAALAGLDAMRLPGWLDRASEAIAAWHDATALEVEAAAATAELAARRAALLEALAAAGLAVDADASVERLAAQAEDGVERAKEGARRREDVADRQRALQRRDAALLKASQAERAWRVEWRAACAASWLGEAAAALPMEAVRDLLVAAAELRPLLDQRADLHGVRIGGMEDDRRRFEAELARVADLLGMAAADRSAHAVAERVAEAGRAADQRRIWTAERAEALGALDALRAQARSHEHRVAAMQEATGGGTLIEVADVLQHAREKANLQAQAAEAERDVLTTLGVATIAEAEAVLEPQEPAALDAEASRLAVELEGVEARVRELHTASRQAADALEAVGGDDAAARLEERRRTELLDLGEKAGRYLRLRIGVAAADRALRAYRDQHRGAMLEGASEAFRLISRGAYRALGTQPGKDGEVLVALPEGGGSKLAAELSKGTRFQLYLALRAAGYGEFAKVRPPVPFIADDIMETFDDPRSAETLRVLAEMAGLGQVIYFTHHDHIRDMAERVVPGVRVHALDG